MDDTGLIAFITITVLVTLFFNVLATRDIFRWVPSIKKQLGLYLLVWCLPIVGLYLANKFANLGWLKPKGGDGSDSVVAGGFMEADSVLNPGAKHRVELMEKQKAEVHHEHKQAGDESNRN
jgi:hypothetical protein